MTVLSAAAVPAIMGAVLLVMSSVLELPESEKLMRSGVEGGVVGPVISTVMVSAAEKSPVLPAVLVDVAVRSCTLAESGGCNYPEPGTVCGGSSHDPVEIRGERDRR